VVWATVASALLAGAPAAMATTLTVSGTADGTGSCSGTACTTLRAAVDAIDAHTYQPGSTIQLGSGLTYTLDASSGGWLNITAPMTIAGQGPAAAAARRSSRRRAMNAC
jgi:hypothetical protein